MYETFLALLYKAFLVAFPNPLPILTNTTSLSCLPCCGNPKLLGNTIPPRMISSRVSPDKLLFILKDPVQITLRSLSCPCASPLSRLCRLSYSFDPTFTTATAVCPNFHSHFLWILSELGAGLWLIYHKSPGSKTILYIQYLFYDCGWVNK